LKIVRPVVVDTDDLSILTAILEAEQRAAVGTSVLEGVQDTVFIPRHHYWHLPKAGGAPRVGLRELHLKA